MTQLDVKDIKSRVLAHADIMDEQGWLAARRKGIGGSDISAICGKNPFKSALDVYLDKINYVIEEDFKENMLWGKLLEPAIANEFSTRTNLKLKQLNVILQHPKHDWALANVDRIILSEPNGILEIKNTILGEIWQDNIPEYYQLQGQWYMAVTGLTYVNFATLVNGRKLLIPEPLERDDELIGYMFDIADRFWQGVKNKVPPAPDGSKAATAVMKMLYPKARRESTMSLPQEAKEHIDAFLTAKDFEKQYEKIKDNAENNLKNMLKDNQYGKFNDFIVNWSNVGGGRLDTAKLKEEKPEIYNQYYKESQTRRFSIKKEKGVNPNDRPKKRLKG